MIRVLRSHGRRQWMVLLVGAAVVLNLVVVMNARAVHDVGVFELDTPADGTGADATSQVHDDWDRVCREVTGSSTTCSTNTTTTGSNAVGWVSEPDRNTTIFTGGGSKDPQDTTSWLWKDGAGGLPDKDNLRHSFAVRYAVPPVAPGAGGTDPTPGSNPADDGNCPAPTPGPCDVLYFGIDRFDNSGDAQLGFWFFQNGIAADGPPQQGGNTFTGGPHAPGDLLILSDFSLGGTTSTINIFKWVASGGDVSTHLQSIGGGPNSDCSIVSINDSFCGIVNKDPTPKSDPSDDLTDSPWPFQDKDGNTNQFAPAELYEGGVNLSSLGLGGECFASFSSESRSSTSPTATLKDFILGGFGACTSSVVTTPKSGGSSISDSPVSIGTGSVDVVDEARVTVNGGGDASGTVSFRLCGPTPLTNTDYTTCLSGGGTAIGSPKTVSGASPVTVTSDTATVTSVGRYCWRADYSGDSSKGIPPASDSTVPSECFRVTPVTPTLETHAGTGPVTLGNSISDTADLSGTANQPGTPIINPTTLGAPAGGTITFVAYGPNDCTTVAFTSSAQTVSGDATYGPVSFTPTAPGTYHWKATYSGSSPNTNGTSDNAACTDTNEDVLVVGSQIKTDQFIYPNDTATVRETPASATGDINGDVTFRLYDTLDHCTANGGTAATGMMLEQTKTLPVTPAASEKSVSTTNTTVQVPDSTTVFWNVRYGGDASHPATASVCVEKTQVTFTDAGYPT